jgi:hypothetical protein
MMNFFDDVSPVAKLGVLHSLVSSIDAAIITTRGHNVYQGIPDFMVRLYGKAFRKYLRLSENEGDIE